MANADAINAVIASIKGETENSKTLGFNMSYSIQNDRTDRSGRDCGTIACIAGHAYVNATGAKGRKITQLGEAYMWDHIFNTAQAKLGLTMEERELLFFGQDEDGEPVIDLDTVTPEHAIRVLENLRDNGVVDWSI